MHGLLLGALANRSVFSRWIAPVLVAGGLIVLLPASAPPAYATSAYTMGEASALAAQSGVPVQVSSLTDTYSTTNANPDGSFTRDESSAPQRVKLADGTWVAPDLTLALRSDGRVGPKASQIDVSFSPGGAGSGLLKLVVKYVPVSIGWPYTLPTPTLSGASALYAEVLPGVDLRLTATTDGYTSVLIVKSATAAANPALASISFSAVNPRVVLAQAAGGGIRYLDLNGRLLFEGAPGQMWDSAGDTGSTAGIDSPTDTGIANPADGPSDGDAIGAVNLALSGTSMVMTPSATMLASTTNVYPLYIDPPLGLHQTGRLLLASFGQASWGWSNSDGEGIGRCGSVGSCDAQKGRPFTKRQYYRYDRANLAGKYIVSATFSAFQTKSVDCSTLTNGVSLYRASSNITSATTWGGPADSTLLGVTDAKPSNSKCTSDANRAGRWLTFTGSALTNAARQLAAGTFSELTVTLKASDETNERSWRRLRHDASFQVTYVPTPSVPSVVTGPCGSITNPAISQVTQPRFSSRVWTLVAPAGGSGDTVGQLKLTIAVEKQVSGTTFAAVGSPVVSSGLVGTGTSITLTMPVLSVGPLYRLRAYTSSYWTQTSHIDSGHAVTCYFKVDPTPPLAPVVKAIYPYAQCTATQCGGAGGIGIYGTFSFAAGDGDTNVAGFRYRLTAGGATQVVMTPPPVSVSIAPIYAGTQHLVVEAIDSAGRVGLPRDFEFAVAAPAQPIGLWSGSGSGSVAGDAVSSGTAHPLTMVNGTFSSRGRTGDSDHTSFQLNGTSSYAASTAPVINTTSSFSVAAWVYLTDDSKDGYVLSQGNNDSASAGWYVGYQASSKRWTFGFHRRDTAGTLVTTATTSDMPALKGVWSRVLGSYDVSQQRLFLSVNGTTSTQVSVPSTEVLPLTSGPFTVGRANLGQNSYSGYFSGLVNEIAAWQRPVTASEFNRWSEDLRVPSYPPHVLVAKWDAAAATSGTAVPDVSQYQRQPLALSANGATHSFPVNDNVPSLVLNGTGGYACAAGPVVDETASFTVSVRASLGTSLSTAADGRRVAVVSQRTSGTGGESTWTIWAEKGPAADGSGSGWRWKASRNLLNSSGAVTATWTVGAESFTSLGQAHTITATFDATPPEANPTFAVLTLYIDGERQVSAADTLPTATADLPQGTGELCVGRQMRAGAWSDYFAGAVQRVEVRVGALLPLQVNSDITAGA